MSVDTLSTPSTRVKRSRGGTQDAPPAKKTTVLARESFKPAKTRTGKFSARYTAMTKLMPPSGNCGTKRAEFARAFMRLDYDYNNNLLCNAQNYLGSVDFLRRYKNDVIDEEACVRQGLETCNQEVDSLCEKINDALVEVILLPSMENSSSYVRDMDLDVLFDRLRDIITFIVMCAFKPESNVEGNTLDCMQDTPNIAKKLSQLLEEKRRVTMQAYYDELSQEY